VNQKGLFLPGFGERDNPLADELPGWVLSDGRMNDPPGAQMDDEKDIESLVEDGVHGEKITGKEGLDVSGDELLPGKA